MNIQTLLLKLETAHEEINAILKKSGEEKANHLMECSSHYSFIDGIFHSIILQDFQDNPHKRKFYEYQIEPIRKRMINISQKNLREQVPYINEYIDQFNFYYGIILGHIVLPGTTEKLQKSLAIKIS